VKAPVGQLKREYQLESLVADSARYTAQTWPTLHELCWVRRVPETLKEAPQAIEVAAPGLREALDKMSYQCLESAYAGVKQRGAVGYSPEASQRALKRGDRPCLKQSPVELKAFEALGRREFACRGEAEKVWAEFKNTQPLTPGASSRIEAIPPSPGRGRPGKGQKPTFTGSPAQWPLYRHPVCRNGNRQAAFFGPPLHWIPTPYRMRSGLRPTRTHKKWNGAFASSKPRCSWPLPGS
jgi:hypothetical protein